MEKITIIGDKKYDEWVPVNNIDYDAEITDNIQMIYCDTRDFAIGFNDETPKIHKNPDCGYEYNQNKGLSKLYNLFGKTNREKYAIGKKDIIKWLDELCKASGGYENDWRFLTANVKNCENWEIKYIRFVRNNKNPDEFIVCNNYLFPIEYREIISNLDKKNLCVE